MDILIVIMGLDIVTLIMVMDILILTHLDYMDIQILGDQGHGYSDDFPVYEALHQIGKQSGPHLA